MAFAENRLLPSDALTLTQQEVLYGSAVTRLTDLVDAENCYAIPWSEVLPMQIEAANERLTERRSAIRVLAKRVEASSIGRFGNRAI